MICLLSRQTKIDNKTDPIKGDMNTMLIVINKVHLNETFRMVRFGMSLCAICKNAMPDVHNSVYLVFFLHEHVQPSTYEVKLAVYVSMFFPMSVVVVVVLVTQCYLDVF